MSQANECELLSINSLVESYVDGNMMVALDILELFVETNLHSLDEAITELFS